MRCGKGGPWVVAGLLWLAGGSIHPSQCAASVFVEGTEVVFVVAGVGLVAAGAFAVADVALTIDQAEQAPGWAATQLGLGGLWAITSALATGSLRSSGARSKALDRWDVVLLGFGALAYQLAAFGMYGLSDAGSPLHRYGAAWGWGFAGSALLNVSLPTMFDMRLLPTPVAWVVTVGTLPLITWAAVDATQGFQHPELLALGALSLVSLAHAVWSLLSPPPVGDKHAGAASRQQAVRLRVEPLLAVRPSRIVGARVRGSF